MSLHYGSLVLDERKEQDLEQLFEHEFVPRLQVRSQEHKTQSSRSAVRTNYNEVVQIEGRITISF